MEPNIITRNLNISGNYINLTYELGSQFGHYYPMTGVTLCDSSGGPNNSIFKNIKINDNQIEVNYKEPRTELDYIAPAHEFGAIKLQTSNSCWDIDIYDNQVQFDHAAIKLMGEGSSIHRRIRIYNNRFDNCSSFHLYENVFNAIYNLQNVNDIDIFKNRIYGLPQEYRYDGANVLNVNYEEG
jgi:hypothetical protein